MCVQFIACGLWNTALLFIKLCCCFLRFQIISTSSHGEGASWERHCWTSRLCPPGELQRRCIHWQSQEAFSGEFDLCEWWGVGLYYSFRITALNVYRVIRGQFCTISWYLFSKLSILNNLRKISIKVDFIIFILQYLI